ncbi:hypothetical protein [Natronorubrum thiooxidans]|uniref:Ribbon-helix-helix protein, copG family n=1 Tax=Natronorubrum thiooxidans TaxID=308853 RepID=A0A1N7GCM3_9EURY|nr:hypothetical protein [Natronorubrum thiooxidans]SIS10304.1 hypothetical protein SAMN05421752_11148 [Natronorubrum thiooxidans]
MPSERSSAEEYIQYPDRDRVEGAKNACAICGSTDSLSVYTFTPSSDAESAALLCPTHYTVAAILDDSPYQETETTSESEHQETRKITVRVPRALVDSADGAAEHREQTRSEFVRDSIQMAIGLQELDTAFDDILAQAVRSPDVSDSQTDQPESTTETDVAFLKERIRTLESLLEDSIEKL